MAEQVNIDKPVRIDFDDLSAADYEDFEEATGMDLLEFATAMQEGRINERNFLKNLKPLTAFLWVVWRKEHPGLSHEDVRNMGLGKLMNNLEVIQAKPSEATRPLEPLQRPAIRN